MNDITIVNWHVKDYGQAEYLDGAQMQFCVHGPEQFNVVAYVGEAEQAKLIAAAPDMLEALLHVASGKSGYLKKVRAAIAKAKGK